MDHIFHYYHSSSGPNVLQIPFWPSPFFLLSLFSHYISIISQLFSTFFSSPLPHHKTLRIYKHGEKANNSDHHEKKCISSLLHKGITKRRSREIASSITGQFGFSHEKRFLFLHLFFCFSFIFISFQE